MMNKEELKKITWIKKEHLENPTEAEIIESEGYNRAIRDVLHQLGDERFKEVPLIFNQPPAHSE